MNYNKLILAAFLLCLSLGFVQCERSGDDGNADFFAPVQFKTQLNLNLPQYLVLTFPQGYVYLTEGNKGTIVYHLPQGGYAAYDRTCSFQPTDACAQVVVDSNMVSMKCGSYKAGANPSFTSCCGSAFDLNTGIAIQKPASRGLKVYYTSYDEAQKVLYVSNTPF